MRFKTELLKAEMKKSKITMADLAKRLQRYNEKASRALVLYWMQGDTIPSTEYAFALGEIFRRKPQDFFEED